MSRVFPQSCRDKAMFIILIVSETILLAIGYDFRYPSNYPQDASNILKGDQGIVNIIRALSHYNQQRTDSESDPKTLKQPGQKEVEGFNFDLIESFVALFFQNSSEEVASHAKSPDGDHESCQYLSGGNTRIEECGCGCGEEIGQTAGQIIELLGLKDCGWDVGKHLNEENLNDNDPEKRDGCDSIFLNLPIIGGKASEYDDIDDEVDDPLYVFHQKRQLQQFIDIQSIYANTIRKDNYSII